MGLHTKVSSSKIPLNNFILFPMIVSGSFLQSGRRKVNKNIISSFVELLKSTMSKSFRNRITARFQQTFDDFSHRKQDIFLQAPPPYPMRLSYCAIVCVCLAVWLRLTPSDQKDFDPTGVLLWTPVHSRTWVWLVSAYCRLHMAGFILCCVARLSIGKHLKALGRESQTRIWWWTVDKGLLILNYYCFKLFHCF